MSGVSRDGEVDAASLAWPHWRLILLLMAVCFLGHMNRISMATAADLRIMAQYDISTTQMGAVYSAFLIAYTLFMIPGGWVIDRLGPTVCPGGRLFWFGAVRGADRRDRPGFERRGRAGAAVYYSLADGNAQHARCTRPPRRPFR